MANSSHVESMFVYFTLCFEQNSTEYHLIAYTLVTVPCILPLCIYILYLGAQQWRSRAKISHTDFFTYNLVVIQIMVSLGSIALVINTVLKIGPILIGCIYLFIISTSAMLVFQILTCLERYMAVVHPVTYLSLKSQTWVLIRKLSCAFVWLHCVLQTICLMVIDSMGGYFTTAMVGLLFSLVVMLFCSLRVLRVLLHQGPGDGAKGNTSKQKALHTITAITGALLVKFTGDAFCLISYFLTNIVNDYGIASSCALYFSGIWFTLPSTMVLPLLFLKRNGKIWCFKTNKQSVKE